MSLLFQFKTRTVLLLVSMLGCFTLLPKAQAVTGQDGAYGPGNSNTAEGASALNTLDPATGGKFNTAVGLNALFSDTAGGRNTAVGVSALRLNTSSSNTAFGIDALNNNTTGNFNVAVGDSALFSNNTASANTAVGSVALFNNTSGTRNTATGFGALFSNNPGADPIEANDNTAVGFGGLATNTTGRENTAVGSQALLNNTEGIDNTAVGFKALFSNSHFGEANTAVGTQALQNNTTVNGDSGSDNTAVGNRALFSNTTGDGNIALGDSAGFNLTTGDLNIDIGNEGVAGESGTIRIGDIQTAAFIAGISGVAVGTEAVFVKSNGQLGTGVPSSARFKTEIKPMEKTSEAILALKPVTFRYKKEIDPKGMLRFGLVAEEVEKVNPDLVGRDAKGQVTTVRYDAVNAMLLNEFLKAHCRIEEQDKRIEELTAQLKQQAALIQKVTDKVELTRPAPQTVVSSQ